MLTYLANTVPPHIAHRIAGWLGITTVLILFCQGVCCENYPDTIWDDWSDAA